MIWQPLTNELLLEELIQKESFKKPVLLFKHSTRCSISISVLNRVERNWNADINELILPYYLDLLNYRAISNKIAVLTDIEHQSPQAIVIKNGNVIYHESHSGIRVDDILESLK